jgi:hypothetical protein
MAILLRILSKALIEEYFSGLELRPGRSVMESATLSAMTRNALSYFESVFNHWCGRIPQLNHTIAHTILARLVALMGREVLEVQRHFCQLSSSQERHPSLSKLRNQKVHGQHKVTRAAFDCSPSDNSFYDVSFTFWKRSCARRRRRWLCRGRRRGARPGGMRR